MPCAGRRPEQNKISLEIYVCILKKAIYIIFSKYIPIEKHQTFAWCFSYVWFVSVSRVLF